MGRRVGASGRSCVASSAPKSAAKTRQSVQAALTDVDYSYTAAKVWSDDGKKYKMSQVPTITTRMHPDCWVADFVFDFPQKEQDDLLAHEQLHYLIGVLAARDCSDAFDALKNKEYDKVKDATEEFNKLFASLDVKKIQRKYDKDTHSQPTKFPVKQKAWASAVDLVHKNKSKRLRPTLIAASLIDATM